MDRRILLVLTISALASMGCSATGEAANGSPSAASTLPGAPTSEPEAGSRPAEVFYLHLYSTLYDVNVPANRYGSSENRRLKENQCLATVTLSPGIEFYVNLPYHYEPEILMSGKVQRQGDHFTGALQIFLQGVDVAYGYELASPVPVDELVRLDEEPFHFAVSREADPYALDHEVD